MIDAGVPPLPAPAEIVDKVDSAVLGQRWQNPTPIGSHVIAGDQAGARAGVPATLALPKALHDVCRSW